MTVCSEMRDVILILLDLVYRSIVAEHEQAESCFFVQSQTVIFLSFLTLIWKHLKGFQSATLSFFIEHQNERLLAYVTVDISVL